MRALKVYVILVAALLTVTSLVHAQETGAIPNKVSESEAVVSRPIVQVLQSMDDRLKAFDDRAARTEASLSKIEGRSDQHKELSLIDLAPALISALTGIAGVFIGVFGSRKQQRERLEQEAALAKVKADNDLRLAERQSKASISSAVVDWQLKQLFLLYGPLHALLGQSFGLYRQMNAALCRTASDRFRLIDSTNPEGQASEDKQEFQILLSNGKWTRFRVVMHMQQVYGQGFHVEIYLDEIVAIGSRIVSVIQEKAGYARPEDAELMRIFACYLAHFAVLDHQHKLAKKLNSEIDTTPNDASLESHPEALLDVDPSAVFPLEFPLLIKTGFLAITRDVEEWKKKTLA